MMYSTKKPLLIVGAIALAITTNAQVFSWAKKTTSAALAISSDQSGNSYLLKANSYLEKRNGAGTTLWNNEIYGSGFPTVTDIATDNTGNTYITGFYASDITQDEYDINGGGRWIRCGAGSFSLPTTIVPDGNILGHKMYFAKINTSGVMTWVKTFSTNTDYTMGHSIATDPSNNVYLLAEGSSSMTFPGLPGLGNSHPLFLLKVNSSGTEVYVKNVTNSYYDSNSNYTGKNEIAVNSSGEVVISKYFAGTRVFNPNGTTTSLTATGGNDVFVAKYASDGTFQWAKKLGGSGADESDAILLDNSGNSYICGLFAATADFDPSATTVNKTASGASDMYLTSWTSSGAFRWVNTYGGSGGESRCTMTKTEFDIHFSGAFSGTVDFNPALATANLTSNGGKDIFTVYMSAASGTYSLAYNTGGTGDDAIHDICTPKIIGTAELYQAGKFAATVDFNPGVPIANLTATGTEICIIKTSADPLSGLAVQDEAQELVDTPEEIALLGLNKPGEAATIKAYPNPFTDKLQITANEQGTVFIYSLNGELMYTSQITGEAATTLDMSSVKAGVYLLEIKTATSSSQQRIVKM